MENLSRLLTKEASYLSLKSITNFNNSHHHHNNDDDDENESELFSQRSSTKSLLAEQSPEEIAISSSLSSTTITKLSLIQNNQLKNDINVCLLLFIYLLFIC